MEDSQQQAVEFRVLGPVEAIREGHRISLGGLRLRALLALLLLEPGRPVNADRLADELWAGEPPDGAEVTLRSYVSRLRATLGTAAAIRSSGAGYALEIEPPQVDATRFERLVREGEAALSQRRPRRAADRLREALALWHGRPFGELADEGALRAEADRLEELRLHAIEQRIEADLQLGASGELVDELETRIREHPYRERLWGQLMLALYRSGRQADALAAYQRARRLLDEQLGLEPGEELRALEVAILRQDVPVPVQRGVAPGLPAPLSSFIGREAEIARASNVLDGARLVTLTGVGGVGKTRLAIETARTIADDFADGVYFVDLAPLVDPELVARRLLDVLGVREQPGTAAVERVLEQLGPLEVLLVIDNCEHLREPVAELAARVLAGCPGLRILATSREVLGVPGEVDLAVPPLALPGQAGDLDAARRSEAVRLFLARARAARPEIADDDATIAIVARICSELEGLPLALELAAARARALAPAEIADRLRDRFKFLVSWRRLTAARHRTLREAMDWSNDLLGPDEQVLLRRLSVFAGGFALDLVANVCVDGDATRALDLLERLVEASLVVVDADGGPTRYRLLETVRQYGAERLEAAGETEELRRRHGVEFARFAVAAWAPLRSAGVQGEWVERIAQERDNLRGALAWSRDAGDFDRMLSIAESMWWFWWIKGELTEGRAWLAEALASAVSSDAILRGRALLGAAGLAWAQGDLEAGERDADAARATFEATGNRFHEGSALNTLGLLADRRGEPERARHLFQTALDRYRTADVAPSVRDRNIATVVDNLGSTSHALEDDVAAARYYEEARSMNLARGDREGVAMNELHLGTLAAESGRLDDARAMLLRALPVYGAVGFLQYAAECLETAAVVARTAGAPAEAAFLLGAATRMRADAGNAPVPWFERLRERESAAVREALGETAADAAMEAGAGTPRGEAIERALTFLAQ